MEGPSAPERSNRKRPQGLLKSRKREGDTKQSPAKRVKRTDLGPDEDLIATISDEHPKVTSEDWEDLQELFLNVLESCEPDNRP